MLQMFEYCGKRFKIYKSQKKACHPIYTVTSRSLANDVALNLKVKTLRGGVAKLSGQAGNFALRLGFLVVLARLLSPRDFGLVAMVTVITGVYGLFTSAGLSSATIQKSAITIQQISTLFWINILVGTALGALCIVTAPVLAQFYHEPRLFWITIAMAAGFLVNAAGVQHSAILQRQLRYVAITAIELFAQFASIVVGIGMALAGFGYWALVGAALISPAMSTASMWIVTGWIPGAPKWDADVNSMLRFGGTITLNTLIVYIAYNFDRLLLGRVWGAQALGIYGQASQLINVPTGSINVAIGGVAFSALSRLQEDPPRLRSYFLKGYSLAISVTVPITMFSALFAEDIILVLLGPKWGEAAEIFRLLAPTILIFGIINPLGWLLLSVGLQVRSLRVAMVIAPLVIVSYVMGLPYGPAGVALAYSAAMTLWLVPHVLWCLHGTVVSPKDLFVATIRPAFGGLASVALAWTVLHGIGELPSPILRLLVAGGVMITAYAGILLFVMGQMKFYSDLLRALLAPTLQHVR
jgi:PST family polysaccharide transporter